MAIIKIYDYTETIQDDWFGDYDQSYVIGQGKLSAESIVPQIEAVADGEDIEVPISSVGGFVFDGWRIYNALISAKARGCKIVTKGEGIVASIASIIFMAGDDRIVSQANLLMIHKPTICPWYFDSMNADDLQREADALNQIQAVINDIYQTNTGLEKDVIDSMINAETYITPSECVTLGFATSQVNAQTEKTSIPENVFKSIFKNADAKTTAYANSFVNVHKINNKMADKNEVLNAVKESSKATNSLLDFFKNAFKNEGDDQPKNASVTKDDGSSIYYDGDLAIGSAVFSDEEMTTPSDDGDHLLDDGRTIVVSEGLVTEIKAEIEASNEEVLNARIAELEAENATLTGSLNSANKALNSANEVLTKFKDTKSNWKPETKKQDFTKPKAEENAKPDLSAEARNARKQEVLNKKNKK